MMIFSLVAMIGLEKCCITSAWASCSKLLEVESSSGYFCSVPLNVIIDVDNYTLRNGTRLINAKIQTIYSKTTKGQETVQEDQF